jgi:hypothetical protein
MLLQIVHNLLRSGDFMHAGLFDTGLSFPRLYQRRLSLYPQVIQKNRSQERGRYLVRGNYQSIRLTMRLLLMTTDYPPSRGGVATYYHNLVKHWPATDQIFVWHKLVKNRFFKYFIYTLVTFLNI